VAVASGTQATEEKLSTSYPTGILRTGRWATQVRCIDKVECRVTWAMFARLQTRPAGNETGPTRLQRSETIMSVSVPKLCTESDPFLDLV